MPRSARHYGMPHGRPGLVRSAIAAPIAGCRKRTDPPTQDECHTKTEDGVPSTLLRRGSWNFRPASRNHAHFPRKRGRRFAVLRREFRSRRDHARSRCAAADAARTRRGCHPTPCPWSPAAVRDRRGLQATECRGEGGGGSSSPASALRRQSAIVSRGWDSHPYPHGRRGKDCHAIYRFFAVALGHTAPRAENGNTEPQPGTGRQQQRLPARSISLCTCAQPTDPPNRNYRPASGALTSALAARAEFEVCARDSPELDKGWCPSRLGLRPSGRSALRPRAHPPDPSPLYTRTHAPHPPNGEQPPGGTAAGTACSGGPLCGIGRQQGQVRCTGEPGRTIRGRGQRAQHGTARTGSCTREEGQQGPTLLRPSPRPHRWNASPPTRARTPRGTHGALQKPLTNPDRMPRLTTGIPWNHNRLRIQLAPTAPRSARAR